MYKRQAIGVVAISFLETNVDLFGLMFGNILTVDPKDLVALGAASLLVLALLTLYFRPLLLASIDEDGAFAAGVNVTRMRLLVLVLLALTVVVALKVVGILLVSALLVLPGAVARSLASLATRTLVRSATRDQSSEPYADSVSVSAPSSPARACARMPCTTPAMRVSTNAR